MKKLILIITLFWLVALCATAQESVIKSSGNLVYNENIINDDYWLKPQKAYLQRRQMYLELCAANNNDGSREGIFSQVARLQLGLPVNEAMVRKNMEVIYANRDCNDFAAGGLLRLVYLNKKKPQLTAALLKEINKCLTSFKYWWDEPMKDTTYKCYHTENHQGLYHTDELLASQLYKKNNFNDGKTGEVHLLHATKLIKRWLNFRSRFGFSEWLSNSYYDVDMMTLSNLHDFAEDPAISAQAGLLINVLLYEISMNNFHGVFGSTHGRAYAPSIKNAWLEPTSSVAKLMFGVGVFNSPKSMGAVSLATSTYRCPVIIEGIATNYAKPTSIHERQSMNVDDAYKYGLSYDNELDTHLFWGMQEFIHPKVIRMSQKISQQYGTWPYKNYDDYIKQYDRQIKANGKIVNPNLDRFALSEANIVTYRTNNYMLSSVQDYRKGSPGYQQHIWQATLGTEAIVFTNHPGSVSEAVTPNFWAGNAIIPRAAQFENVFACVYNITNNSGLPYSHAYFPRYAFDEVLNKGNWTFGKKGDGYIALYSQHPVTWGKDAKGLENELKADSRENIWVCEMGTKESWGSFNKFVQAIIASSINCAGNQVNYQSPSVGKFEFGWTDPLLVKNINIPLNNTPRFNTPYSQTAFTADNLEIDNAGKKLVLDFKSGKRILKTGNRTH